MPDLHCVLWFVLEYDVPMARVRIIAINGLIGCGKGSIASYLREKHGYTILSFADSLKDVCSTVFGWDRKLLEGDTVESRVFRENPDPFWSEYFGKEWTPRYALQIIGTELFRYGLDLFIWAAVAQKKIESAPDQKFVIPDLRFDNEAEMIRDLGGQIWNVRRGPEPEWVPTALYEPHLMTDRYPHIHISEWSGVKLQYDHIIFNNSTLEDLFREVERLL